MSLVVTKLSGVDRSTRARLRANAPGSCQGMASSKLLARSYSPYSVVLEGATVPLYG